MNLELLTQFIPQFGEGVLLTIQLLSLSLVIGFVFSLLVALAKSSSFFPFQVPARAFIYFFRGTPLLVQIYIIYYGLGQFKWVRETAWLWNYLAEPFYCALIALTLNNIGYTAEIIHHALVTTDKGEVEAARAFGMTKTQSLSHIIIPSALRRSIPAYANEVIFMLHATSLVSVITLLDITGVARNLYSRHYAPFEAFIVAALYYLVLSGIISLVFNRVEKRFHRHLMAR